ncbi:MAG: hypothetical protein F4Y00_00345 [Bacteroidetes bacterium SB0662_bin_6]|nr:hypothetical protein [Bacteroidetes bacterium SB0668_bin_1]MYE03419.1 hypothetical protein [Bacteroidetes bacterium SB0662_bin_6]
MKDKEKMIINIPPDFVRLTGEKARMFRDKFAWEMVARESDGGPDRARILARSEQFVIKLYLKGEQMYYDVGVDQNEESFVAIDPVCAARLLGEAVPFMQMKAPNPGMQYSTA